MAAQLIGITGRKRSGKDTFAARLRFAHGFDTVSFADPLKAAALRLNPLIPVAGPGVGDGVGYPQVERLEDVITVHGWEAAKDRFPEVRLILQRLGTDAVRALDPEFWVRMAVGKLDPDVPAAFADVRFPNEADAIRRMGGHIVRITRPGLDTTDAHPSETAMDGYNVDLDVLNNGTVNDLYHRADRFVRNLY